MAEVSSSPLPPVPISAGGGRRPADLVARSTLLVVFAAMVATFWILRPDTFATSSNLQAILNQAAVVAIFGVAVTVVLLSGEFDLAFPSIADSTTILIGILVTTAGLTSTLGVTTALLGGLAVAATFGLLSGTALAIGKVPSFVASLAVGSLATGVELGLQDRIDGGLKQISTLDLPPALQDIGQFTIPGTELRIGVLIAAVVAISVWLLLRSTVFGRHVHAVGGNADAAYLAGVPVARVRILVFTLAGLLGGVAAFVSIVQQGYFFGASPPLLLQTYTVAFLGTAVLARRRFSIGGTITAVLFLAVLANGLGLLNKPTWITSLVNGAVLLTAVVLTRRRTP